MKKILAIALVLVMAFGTVGYAADEFAETETVNVNLLANDENTKIYIGRASAGYTDSYEYSGSNYASVYFDLKAEVKMDEINKKLTELVTENVEEAKKAAVTGKFSVKITLPSGLKLSDKYYETSKFVIENGANFEDIYVMPEKADVNVASNVITFDVVLKDGLKGENLFTYENETVKSKLGDAVVLTCRNAVVPTKIGTYAVKGEVKGNTIIEKADKSVKYKINYDFGDIPDAKLVIKKASSSSSSSRPNNVSGVITGPNTPSAPVESTNKTVEFILGTGTESEIENTSITVTSGNKITLPETAGTREGFVFEGWAVNGQPASGEITITKDTVITAKWINTVPAAGLNSAEHITFIQGYPDGTVKPDGNITRGEVSTIFYRLLTEEKKAEIQAETSDFADVKGNWAETAIATLKNGGYINGYEDGTFKPDATITRAEFVAIAAKFADAKDGAKSGYTDVSGHWAENAINTVSDYCWIGGYEDGTFKPDATITRAEAVKIINRMLVRYADKDSIVDGVTIFPDNGENDWYYYDIIEATNEHGHQRRENGYSEDWTE